MGTAIYTGVTGLQTHQRRMDVIAANISNVNTPGYRAARALFQDLFSQTLEGGRGPVGNFGGSNPVQVGLGVQLATIDTIHQQGSLQTTGNNSDLAVQGTGFFVLSNGEGMHYTRDGSFTLNALGQLVDPATGMRVQGYLVDESGEVNVSSEPTNLEVPVGGTSIVRATEEVRVRGNLNSRAEAGDTVERSANVFDSLGTPRELLTTFEKIPQVSVGGTNYNAWSYVVEYTNSETPPVTTQVGEGVVLFDEDGNYFDEGTLSGGVFTSRPEGSPEVSVPLGAFGGMDTYPETPFEFEIDFSSVTELASDSDVTVTNQDGFARGTLESFNIARDGTINGVFSNGLTRVIGQIALASFANVGGLERDGSNMFRDTPASGTPQIGLPNTGGRGQVSGGVLEGSNVDLGTEFSNMIVTQRGFQANARTITTADTLLQETVNLVR
ncbi:MAG: flagellar hook protein FlgE [Candidatus Hydrogenedentota bacterium]